VIVGRGWLNVRIAEKSFSIGECGGLGRGSVK
jgi:hypothetical protein